VTKPTFLAPLLRRNARACVLVDSRRDAVLASRVEPAFDSKTRNRGLLGRTTVPEDYVLIIAPSNAVHTWFMSVPIDVLFVSRDGTVTKACRDVKPWRVAGSLRAFAAIESAAGFIDRHGIRPGAKVSLREAPADCASAEP
jgi:uncharacterized membrane protein (UPF0127 family)